MKAAIMVPGEGGGTWDIRETQRPVVPPGHTLLRVHACRSTGNSAVHTMRTQPVPAPEARVGGGDAAGEIVELGRGRRLKPGERAMGGAPAGSPNIAW
jgi:threonine dehydrogenase-like Zn-dependent dehydrogenase